MRNDVCFNCCYYCHHFPRNSFTGFSFAAPDLTHVGPLCTGFPSMSDAFIWMDPTVPDTLCKLDCRIALTFRQNLDCNFVQLPTDPNAYPASSHGQHFNSVRQFCSAFDPGPGCFCGDNLQVVCVAGLGSQTAHQEWNFAKSTAACYKCRCSWGRPVVQDIVRFILPTGERLGSSQ